MYTHPFFYQIIKAMTAFVLFFILMVYLFKKLTRAYRSNVSGNLNVPALSNLIALGITIVFFYASFNDFFSKIISLFTSLIDLIAAYFTSMPIDKSQALVSQFLDNIQKFQYGMLFIFIISWIAISIGIRQVLSKEKSTDIPLFENNLVAKNVFVGIVLVFSIYLCIASIIAIPEFQALENSSFDNQEVVAFKKTLEDSTINKQFANLPVQIRKTGILRFQSSTFRFNELSSDITLFNEIVTNTKDDLYQKSKRASVNYQAALEEKTAAKEKNKFKSALISWYLNQQTVVSKLTFEKSALDKAIDDRINDINTIEKDSALIKANKLEQIEQAYGQSDHIYNRAQSSMDDATNYLNDFRTKNDVMPLRPDIGEQFGIFETMSGWLLKTESLSLALIVGLFAFGLLGAIGSSFIRQKITANTDVPNYDYVPNLPVVLISGLSSAIVVFLAVKGAVVVFATKDANLNPYILFFTCLVAAVYSEDIWTWARKRLQDSFNKSGTTPTEGKTDSNTGKKQAAGGAAHNDTGEKKTTGDTGSSEVSSSQAAEKKITDGGTVTNQGQASDGGAPGNEEAGGGSKDAENG